jgi:hypothetical protein
MTPHDSATRAATRDAPIENWRPPAVSVWDAVVWRRIGDNATRHPPGRT